VNARAREARGAKSPGRSGLAAAAVVGLAAAACGGGGAEAVELGLVNRTGVPVGIYANGAWIGTYPVDAEASAIPIRGRGGPPWTIEVRDAAGITLGAFEVDGSAGAGTRFDTPCGTIWTWAGDRDDLDIDEDPAQRSSDCG
jgi:hypothetical protein